MSGSGSKWRKGILERAGVEFSTASPSIDEKAVMSNFPQGRENADPSELTLAIAMAKAEVLVAQFSDKAVLLITSGLQLSC